MIGGRLGAAHLRLFRDAASARKVARVVDEAETIDRARPSTHWRSVKPGDPDVLRMIPLMPWDRSVAAVIPGTQPEHETIRRLSRR